jgi:hypothetical protein
LTISRAALRREMAAAGCPVFSKILGKMVNANKTARFSNDIGHCVPAFVCPAVQLSSSITRGISTASSLRTSRPSLAATCRTGIPIAELGYPETTATDCRLSILATSENESSMVNSAPPHRWLATTSG